MMDLSRVSNNDIYTEYRKRAENADRVYELFQNKNWWRSPRFWIFGPTLMVYIGLIGLAVHALITDVFSESLLAVIFLDFTFPTFLTLIGVPLAGCLVSVLLEKKFKRMFEQKHPEESFWVAHIQKY